MKMISETLLIRLKNVLSSLILSIKKHILLLIAESSRLISDILKIAVTLKLEVFLVEDDIKSAFNSFIIALHFSSREVCFWNRILKLN